MGRTPCCDKEHNKKGAWSIDEDQRLINHINLHGEGNWRTLPRQAGLLRCGKSCRLRWINYLKPGLKRGNFTKEEDDLIIHLHRVLGNKWSLIAARLPGRTDNEIKNYWNTHIKRMLYDSGIDPSTHEPLKTATTVTTNKKKKGIMNNNSTTASATSTVISSSSNNINTEKNSDYHYFNVYLSTKMNFESMNGEESNSCSGVSTDEAYHPHLNLDLSLAPPISSHYPQVSHSVGSDLFKPNEQQLQSAAAATNNNVFIDFMGPRI